MKTPLRFILLASLLLLFGCAEQSYRMTLKSTNTPTMEEINRGVKVAREAMAKLFKENNIDAEAKITINSLRTESVNGKETTLADIDFYIEPFQGKVFYQPGVYDIRKSLTGIHHLAAIKVFLDNLSQNVKNYSLRDVKLYAEFEGSSDGSGAGRTVGFYRGEYGRNITESRVMTNNTYTPFSIKANDQINNLQLAFLRAYGMYWGLLVTLKDNGMDENSFAKKLFIVKESRATGAEFRYGRVTIEVSAKR